MFVRTVVSLLRLAGPKIILRAWPLRARVAGVTPPPALRLVGGAAATTHFPSGFAFYGTSSATDQLLKDLKSINENIVTVYEARIKREEKESRVDKFWEDRNEKVAALLALDYTAVPPPKADVLKTEDVQKQAEGLRDEIDELANKPRRSKLENKSLAKKRKEKKELNKILQKRGYPEVR